LTTSTADAGSPTIAAAAARDGDISTLLDDGFAKVRAGKTTLAEVLSAMSE
jgi:type II secretory ATPase GspE/PulE/Tfp pilus assembly ATPase PilB-like protein